MYFSVETLWRILSAVSSSDRLYWLEDTIAAIRQGLLLLNYTTEFSNPKDGESGQGGGKSRTKIFIQVLLHGGHIMSSDAREACCRPHLLKLEEKKKKKYMLCCISNGGKITDEKFWR